MLIRGPTAVAKALDETHMSQASSVGRFVGHSTVAAARA